MERLTGDELLRHLALKRGAVRTMLGHGFHPLKAQHRWSIPNRLPVHPQGRTPIGGQNSPPIDTARQPEKQGRAHRDQDLVELARLFRIRRFGVDSASGDWREGSNLVGSRLFGREDAGGAPTLALLNTVRQLIRSGAAADRAGLVRALRAAGHADTRAPGFDEDVKALRKYSKEECKRLIRHTTLPIDHGNLAHP